MIKILAMDVDGTLTDGKLYIGNDGELCKAFNVKDGYAINNILPQHGIIPVIITGRNSDIVEKRCKELNIQALYQGCVNKKEKLIEIAKMYGIHCNEKGELPGVAYVGDDLPDLECMEIAEIAGCPKDAAIEVVQNSDFVSTKTGGDGVVREFVDWMIQKC